MDNRERISELRAKLSDKYMAQLMEAEKRGKRQKFVYKLVGGLGILSMFATSIHHLSFQDFNNLDYFRYYGGMVAALGGFGSIIGTSADRDWMRVYSSMQQLNEHDF
jgi:hypothetical protein